MCIHNSYEDNREVSFKLWKHESELVEAWMTTFFSSVSELCDETMVLSLLSGLKDDANPPSVPRTLPITDDKSNS